MAFTVTKEIAVAKSYPDLHLEIPADSEVTTITYEVLNVALSGTAGTLDYTTTVDDVTSAWIRSASFVYSGTGIPVEEAEAALKELVA